MGRKTELFRAAVVPSPLTGESDRKWAKWGEEDTIKSGVFWIQKVGFEGLTGVSAHVVVCESRGLIGSDPTGGHLRTLGQVTEALLEVAPRVPGAFRGKT